MTGTLTDSVNTLVKYIDNMTVAINKGITIKGLITYTITPVVKGLPTVQGNVTNYVTSAGALVDSANDSVSGNIKNAISDLEQVLSLTEKLNGELNNSLQLNSVISQLTGTDETYLNIEINSLTPAYIASLKKDMEDADQAYINSKWNGDSKEEIAEKYQAYLLASQIYHEDENVPSNLKIISKQMLQVVTDMQSVQNAMDTLQGDVNTIIEILKMPNYNKGIIEMKIQVLKDKISNLPSYC